MYQRLRDNKGKVVFDNGPPANGQLPSSSKTTVETPPNGAYDSSLPYGSARTRAFIQLEFKKRRRVQIENLHTAIKKAARAR